MGDAFIDVGLMASSHISSSSVAEPVYGNSLDNSPDLNTNYLQGLDPLQRQGEIVKAIWPTPSASARIDWQNFCNIYEAIKATAQPNYKSAKIQVSSGLNLDEWDQALAHYHDRHICQYLRYGWPLGYHKTNPPASADQNHPSTIQHLEHVLKFVEKELSLGALVGPFSEPPFQPWTRVSPIMRRPKKDSKERRVIVDLTYPEGYGVNDGIDIYNYYGQNISYTLPTLGDMVSRLQACGKGALVWKADLAKAYRQLRVNPLDTPLLAMKVHNKYYLDVCPPFGCRTSSAACQRMSNALVYLMRTDGYFVLAYLDDYGGCEEDQSIAHESYHHFLDLAKTLGLELAEHKCVPPSTKIEWLGYMVDTIDMSVSIPAPKLLEVVSECVSWASKTRANKRMIQSLAGKLLHLTSCIIPARRFVVRVLATLRAMADDAWTTLSPEFKLDLAWFYNYAEAANGTYYYTPARREVVIECDSSHVAGGGVADGFCYAWKYSSQHKNRFSNIHHLEAINLIVAYNTLAKYVATPGVLIVINTDNMASSIALETGRTKNSTLGNCAQELWLQATINNHVVEIRHKPGHDIPLADALSRQYHEHVKADYVANAISSHNLTIVSPKLNGYKFFSEYI